MNLESRSAVVIDVETSGVNPFRNDVLAVGLVPLNSDLPSAEIYVRPEHIEWSPYARTIFEGYSAEWERNAVSPKAACSAIEDYLKQTFSKLPVTPIGHNIGFDVAFMRKLAFLGGRDELLGLSHRAVDTHTLLFVLVSKGTLPSSVLSSDGAFRHFRIDVPNKMRHTAIGDALATRELFLRLSQLLE